MATINATVYIFDPLQDSLLTSTAAVRKSDTAEIHTIKSVSTVIFDPTSDELLTSTGYKRRSPGDLGYGSIPVVGTIFGASAILPVRDRRG